MVLHGIEFTSHIFSNKSCEVGHIKEEAYRSVVYTQCVDSLKEICVKSSRQLD